jgi:hypothetical protein
VNGNRGLAWDFSTGGCITTHFPELKGFLISPFVQFAQQSDHGQLVIHLNDGTTFQDGADRERHLWTFGSMVDRAIVKNGPRWAVRAGKNFGGGPAVKNAGGLYLVGGVVFPLDHPVELGRAMRRMVGLKPHPADSSAAQPQKSSR